MAKSKRSNYLIDKPFQLGFIFKYLIIILLAIIMGFVLTITYYWIKDQIYKLDTLITISQRGQITVGKKKLFIYNKEKLEVLESKNETTGEPVYTCYTRYNDTDSVYYPGDILENVNLNDLEPKIGPIPRSTTLTSLLIIPLLLTLGILLVTITIYSLFFSHRVAGPIYRLRVSLDRMLANDFDFKIRARRTDFFLNIVEKLEQLRQNIVDKKK